MSEILNKEVLGGDLKITFNQGTATLTFKINGSLGETSFSQTVKSDYLIDKITDAIPGDWDKAPGELLKAALKNL